MSFEILENTICPYTMTYATCLDFIKKGNKRLINIGDTISIDVNRSHQYFQFKRQIIALGGSVIGKVVQCRMGSILLEFDDGIINGHHGDLYDGSTTHWWI